MKTFEEFQAYKRNKKVFLGGTCDGSKWRDDVISGLLVDYFNPVVEKWTPACEYEELEQRQKCDYCLYVITPKMKGFYSIAELIDDSHVSPEKTLFCFLQKDGDDVFDEHQIKSLNAIANMVTRNGGNWFKDLQSVVSYINTHSYINR